MKISIYSIRHVENITRQALSPVTPIFRTCPKCSLSACGGGRVLVVKFHKFQTTKMAGLLAGNTNTSCAFFENEIILGDPSSSKNSCRGGQGDVQAKMGASGRMYAIVNPLKFGRYRLLLICSD